MQAILAAVALRAAVDPCKHVTIVCPASLRGGWQGEIRRWLGEDAVLLEGHADQRARVVASRPAWLITHYEQVTRDHEVHRAHAPDLLVVDEAQRAKGLATKTARTLKRIEPRYLFALTGTPLENRLEEAYAVAQLIDQRLLPPLWQIERDHFVREDGRRVVLYRNLDALRSNLAPAFLRRRKEDVALELPERLRSVVFVPMHAAVLPTYDDVMQQVRQIASKKVTLPADLDRMQRLLVIARRCRNGPHMLGKPFDDGDVPKLQELEQALTDLCLGEGREAVQILLLVAKASLEGSILSQHDTKRNVLENVWARDGDDQIAAPGGSGAFRAMVEALLATTGPAAPPRPATEAYAPPSVRVRSATPAAGPSRGGQPSGPALSPPSSPPLRPTPPPSEAPGPTPAMAAPAVDLTPLATVLATVAPTLPVDHRQSLATVFRALALAIDPTGPS